jgi:hypothetical protein
MKADSLAYFILVIVSFVAWYFLLKMVFLSPSFESYDFLILGEAIVAVVLAYIVSRESNRF